MNRSKVIAIGLVCIFMGSIFSALATRTITDSSDTIYTKIACSNGNVYDATGANLQTAIYSVDNGTGDSIGSVCIPSLITVTTTLKITSHVRLYSITGGGLVFGSNINMSMIENYDQTNGNNNITFDGLILDGKCMTVTGGFPSPDSPQNYQNGIEFYQTGTNSKNILIKDCVIKNFTGYGVYILGDDSSVESCDVGYSGKNFEGTGKLQWRSIGVCFESGSGNKIIDNTIHDCYSNGITFESRTGHIWSKNNIASGNVIYNCQIGIYNEHNNKTIISANIIYNCNKYGAYPLGATGGIRIGTANVHGQVNNSIISDNIITHCGYLPNTSSITVFGDNNIISDNLIENAIGRGITLWEPGENCTIDNNIIINSSDRGINCVQKNATITGNTLNFCGGTAAIYYDINTGYGYFGGIVSLNKILYPVTGTYGMYVKFHGTRIMGNMVTGSTVDGIRINAGNITFFGNYIESVTGDGIEIRSDSNTPQNCSFFGNTFKSCGGYGVNLPAAAKDFLFMGNTGISCTSGIIEPSVGTRVDIIYTLNSFSSIPTVNMTSGASGLIQIGFMWYNIATNILSIYDGSAWDQVTFT